MNIMNLFKEKCVALEDTSCIITNRMQHLHSTESLQNSNASKLEEAKKYLGVKYILHPDNATKRKEQGK